MFSKKSTQKDIRQRHLQRHKDICLKLPRIPPSPRLNVVPSLKKPCQAAKTRNEQANLQPTLNKGGGGASLTIFVTDCSFIFRNLEFCTNPQSWTIGCKQIHKIKQNRFLCGVFYS